MCDSSGNIYGEKILQLLKHTFYKYSPSEGGSDSMFETQSGSLPFILFYLHVDACAFANRSACQVKAARQNSERKAWVQG